MCSVILKNYISTMKLFKSASTILLLLGQCGALASDPTPPSCHVTTAGSCPPNVTEYGCRDDQTWTATAIVQDLQSGLRRVTVSPPDGSTLVDDFTPGITTQVNVSHTAPCCIWEAEIIATDMEDNQNNNNCWLYQACGRMRVFHFTATEVFVEWVLPCEFANVEIYELIGTNMLTDPPQQENFNTVHCLDQKCSFNVTNVPACVNYQVDLKAYEFENPANVINYNSYLITTNETETSEPRSLSMTEVTTTTITISWVEPGINKYCIEQYQICYRSLPARELICNTTTEKIFQLTSLTPCNNYHITVTALTPTGLESRPAIINQRTSSLIPGVPQNLTIFNVDKDSVSFGWTPPVTNPTCVNGYIHKCSPTDQSITTHIQTMAQDTENVTVDGLSPCLDYTCCVASLYYQPDENGITESEFICFNTTTESLAPSEPTCMVAMASLDHIDIFWEEPEVAPNCVTSYDISWFNVDSGEVFNDTMDALHLEYRIENLLPCSTYSITLKALDEENNEASRTITKKTKDTAPGIVSNLVIEDRTSSSFRACWDPPMVNPQCVNNFDTEAIGCRPHKTSYSKIHSNDGHVCSPEDGFCCDSDITFKVTLLSESGDRSPEASITVTTKECTSSTTIAPASTSSSPTTLITTTGFTTTATSTPP